MSNAKYIVVDGLDGSGKGEVIKALEEIFPSDLLIRTREPGGTLLAEKIRAILLTEKMDPFTEMCLFLGARREVRNMVERFLSQGRHVLSDRSDSSTFAFQICGRERGYLEESFWRLNDLLSPHPTLYLFLDLPAEVAQGRLKKRESSGGEMSKFDAEEIAFHNRVREGFRKFSEKSKVKCLFVDAARSREVVAKEVIDHIKEHLNS